MSDVAAHRPAWVPTDDERRLVEHYVSLGYTQEQVGALMEKSVDTLDRHCRSELDLGKLRVNAKIGGKLFQKAMGGDTAALIFWAKTQMGWREIDRHEHTGIDGGPIEITAVERTFIHMEPKPLRLVNRADD